MCIFPDGCPRCLLHLPLTRGAHPSGNLPGRKAGGQHSFRASHAGTPRCVPCKTNKCPGYSLMVPLGWFCLDWTIWSGNTTEPERGIQHLPQIVSITAFFFFFLILLSSQHAQIFWEPCCWQGEGPLAQACVVHLAGSVKHPAASPWSWSSTCPSPSPTAKDWCLGCSILVGAACEQELLQGRLIIWNVFLFLWVVRWFLLCFVCCLSSLACMLKLALHFHFNPSLILMQAAM